MLKEGGTGRRVKRRAAKGNVRKEKNVSNEWWNEEKIKEGKNLTVKL